MIQTTGCYYMILAVYISLWSCQLITCHLTHSLIVLTDSYINLYKILDISLGILHLKTQRKVRRKSLENRKKFYETKTDEDNNKKKCSPNQAITLFDTVCTYQFKRLPVLGSFVNGLFLAALLMSAAIEGIQTCFHANHSDPDGQTSILLEHPITYPGILIGFALVGAMMQWCSIKAHEMREQELGSESLLDIAASNCNHNNDDNINELDVGQLNSSYSKLDKSVREITLETPSGNLNQENENSLPKSNSTELRENKSVGADLNTSGDGFVPVPLDDPNDDQFTRISLKSLKFLPESDSRTAINSISRDLEAEAGGNIRKKSSISDRWWLVVRYCASPVSLIACALIIYFIHEEMVTEIADATFAILVVILLFFASYPPMKKAGKVLLQTAPDGVDLDKLKRCLRSISPLIVDIQELHVWSLTARSNRIATCHLHLNKDKIVSDEQVYNLLREAKSKFSSQNIRCSTIQPIFVESIPK